MYCTHCGHENPSGANFCGNCGRPLAAGEATTGALRPEEESVEAQDESPDEAQGEGQDEGLGEASSITTSDLEPGTALLVGVRGPNRGAKFLLDREVVTVGRHPDSDIFLDDITVSRRHAEFRRDQGRFWVHDVGSLNGTYVNGRRADDVLLGSGDEVQVGKFKLVVFVADEA